MDKESVVWSKEVSLQDFGVKFHYKDGNIYYGLENECLYKLNTSNVEQKSIIEMPEWVEDDWEKEIYYCDNFIVIKVYEVDSEYRKIELLLYNYDGHLCSKEKI